jgi:hypothetical protein
MKPTALEINEALSMVKNLMDHGLKRALMYNGEYNELGYWEWYCDYRKYFMSIGLYVFSGASKVVFFKDDWNWVIKLGFMRETNTSFVARGTDFNYCEIEADIYRNAVSNHLDEYFAATYACGEVDGVQVFLQEKVTTIEDELTEKVDEYSSSHNIWDTDEDFTSKDYIAAILGEDFDDYMDLVEFVDEHDINDLHALNWGKTADGRIVMIDFSGYLD